MALQQFTCRFEKSVDDAIDKITIKENITKNKAMNKIIQLGLDAYFKKNEISESEKIEKSLAPRFDELQEDIQALSYQVKAVDLKTFQATSFISDFAKAVLNDADKFKILSEGVLGKTEKYRNRMKFVPRFGVIVYKYLQNILNKEIPDQFFTDIKNTHTTMIKKE